MYRLITNKSFLLFIITIQEAFSAVIPYILLLSVFTLLKFVVSYFHIFSTDELQNFIEFLQKGSSLVIVIAISYFLSLRLKVSQAIAIILSVSALLSTLYLTKDTTEIILPSGFTVLSLTIPVLSTLFLYKLYPYFTLKLPVCDVNKHVYRLFNYLFVYVIAYFLTIIVFLFFDHISNIILDFFIKWSVSLPDFFIYLIRDFFVQIGWFLGIHGDHMANAAFGKDILFKEVFPNLKYVDFNRLFVSIGGSGVGLSLLIAMLLYIKDSSYKAITKISIPFVIFNIDTLLIYALVVFNRFLLIPFLFLPIANILLAYGVLTILNISFVAANISWMTPVFLDSFVKTSGDLIVWILQVVLIVFDTIVYGYFIKRFQKAQQVGDREYLLKKNLDLEEEIRSKMDIKAFISHKEIIEADAKIEKIIENLNKNNLYVYYQPKILLETYGCNRFEALLRYQEDGIIKGPIFLTDIENAGLAPIIDIWVSKQVNQDIEKWNKDDFFPQISVNLHPDTIQNSDAIDQIIKILKNKKVVFEIIERSFLKGTTAEENLRKLQANKFGIAIDDFGVGYSSLETLVKYEIDELKLDKSLIDIVGNIKGRTICKNITNLCHELGYQVVAEGVETLRQVEDVTKINIDYIQGYYFSEALPFDEIFQFSTEFKKKYTMRKIIELMNKT